MKFTRKPKEAESKGNRRFSALSSGSYGHTASVLAGDVPSGGAGSGAGSGADAEEPQSEEFWHDFETGEDSDELPVGARVIPYPPSPTAEQASVLPVCGQRVCSPRPESSYPAWRGHSVRRHGWHLGWNANVTWRLTHSGHSWLRFRWQTRWGFSCVGDSG